MVLVLITEPCTAGMDLRKHQFGISLSAKVCFSEYNFYNVIYEKGVPLSIKF
jgi:hypothetical protein